VFVAVGAEPAAAASAALEGLRRQHAELAGAIAEPRLRDLFLVSAAVKTEHLEIALYTGLIAIARRVAVEAGPLDENLDEEQRALTGFEQAGAALLERTPS
jgi:ferritin-like metal-binding protein YciE